MAYENLLKSVDESAEERIRDLREKTRRTVEELKSGAKKEGDAKAEALLEAAARAAATERNRQVFLTKSEIKQRLIRLKEEQFSEAFSDARNRLTTLRKDPAYPKIFRNLANEAVQAIGGTDIQVHISRDDVDLCKRTLADMKIAATVIADLETLGGLVVGNADGSVTVSNTVESRLERGKERLKREVYGILFGA